MAKLQSPLRTTFLAGVFAGLPIAITIFIIYKINEWTSGISLALFGREIPFVGVVISIAAIYLTGLIVSVSIGKYFLRLIDRILIRIPVLRPIYESWKHISFIPGGGEGTFAHVVLVPDESSQMRLLGFSSGHSPPDDPDLICVFVPNVPNPIQGRLYFVSRAKVRFTKLTTEEAFKLVLSNGNYLPSGLAQDLPK